ncbi:MAG: cob(I)yrinic acid a,c-diamide adenosyltransferase, partial [Gammaproteobacteria bacterium]|nr:cob(I)yrinic acid a,c-diamide adenosyltransferase [Gammaproteobacteria bacterium]
MSKIYTRTGDEGTTGLGDGSRINKNHLRIKSLGSLDELNASIGLLRTEIIPANVDHMLAVIQHQLFDLGGEMSLPGQTLIQQNYVAGLEHWLDELNEALPPLKEFILPGGCESAARC